MLIYIISHSGWSLARIFMKERAKILVKLLFLPRKREREREREKCYRVNSILSHILSSFAIVLPSNREFFSLIFLPL